jgi:hypothetical protein
MSARRLHHLVLCVADHAAARAAYGRFGFTTTPPAQMPFGTVNSLVQLQGNYLELLAVADPAAIPAAAPGKFGFASYNADFLRRRQGMSMLACSGEDAEREHAGFAALGLATSAPFYFARQATLPDGSQATVAFTLTFVTDPAMPEAAFFTCQEHAPEFFWRPEYQRHANGAHHASDAVLRAEDPAALAPFFAKLLGGESVERRGDGLVVATALGTVSVMTPGAVAARFPGIVLRDAPATPHFAAYRIAVAALDETERVLRANDVRHRRQDRSLVVPPEEAFGVVIEFVQK